MAIKNIEKEKAIELRKKGFSYSEILKEVPVAKSTLSLWLREIGLTKRQKQRLTKKKLLAMKRGWEATRNKRIEKSKKIKEIASKEIQKISKKELWLMGIVLYWAEGAKEKPYRTGERVHLMSIDERILLIFKKWLIECCCIDEDDIYYDVYIHENSTHSSDAVRNHWRKVLSIPQKQTIPIYYKRGKVKTIRKNIGKTYFGICRINIRKSTDFNRKIDGWITGICDNIL